VRCVVKVFAPDASARRLALAEFRGLEALAHPNVARLRDIGRCDDGRLFLVTDRIVGPGIESVATISDDTRRRAIFERVALDLSSALAHLHARGIVHGDVCPANVRLSQEERPLPRAVLIDFGLAGPPLSGGGGARGTLGYAAPEALTGVRSPGVDLFALGATLFEGWSGTSPFGHGLSAVERMLVGRAPKLSSIRPGLGEGWDRLLGRLLAADPAERPASAREVLRESLRLSAGAATPTEVDLGVPYPDGDPLAGIVVGRRAERATLRAVLDKLSDGAAPASALVLLGGPGAGRRTLFEVVARDVAVATAVGTMAPIEIWRGDLDALERFAGVGPALPDDDAQRAAEARMAALAEAIELRARDRPLCIFLDEGAPAGVFAGFMAGAPPTGRTLLVLPSGVSIDRPFAMAIVLPHLTAIEVGELVAAGVDEAPPPGVIEGIAGAARGNVALATVLVRRLIASLRSGSGVAATIEPGADLDLLLQRSFAALPPDAQRLVLATALVGDRAAEAAALDEETAARAHAAARAMGWIDLGPDGAPRLPGPAHHRAALATVPRAMATAIADGALALLGADDPRRADALATAGRATEAAEVLRRAADAALVSGASARASALLERAAALAPTALGFAERLILATGLGILGRYDDAERVLTEARAQAQGPVETVAGCEREAWLRARRGDLDGARLTLERGLAESAGAGVPAVGLRARLGRLLVTAGRFRESLAIVEPLIDDLALVATQSAARALCVESALLAGAYLGELPRARQRLAELAEMSGAPETRLAYLEGLLAQLAGLEDQARDAYRRAYEIGSRQNDVHTVAAVALNLGGLLTEEGLYGEALTACARAVRELGRLGAAAELVPALVNAANLFVDLGDLSGARRAIERARGLAKSSDATRALATASFVEGDLARRTGQTEPAVACYRSAAALFVDLAQPAAAASALLAAAETLASGGRFGDGRRLLAEAERLRDLGPDLADDPEIARTQAILALADAGGDESAAALGHRLAELARRARAHARRPRAWRLAALAGRLAARASAPEEARAAFDLARAIFQEVRVATPEHHRAALDRDPEAAWLRPEGSGAAADEPLAARAIAAESRLRRLLRINKRLNSELRLPRLLEMIVDTVIELTDAERGFLLLEDDGGELNVKVARNIDQQTLETAEFELSRSIARQAAAGGEPIVTIDAAGDARFREALSVSDLHLRSVLAVPLVIKGRAAGTIYVDHRLRKGAFDQEDVRLVLDFAEQAAIALENARLLAELRRRERQVEALNRRLETELAVRREELSGIKVELRESREALAVRYDYRNIIGRTPRMLELFRLIDRITDTTLSVVIQGESGTGKELVARAIHANGPRKDRPFVGENCAAIPETLLESTLFGYARGAFTGAEHDTRGLFEIADGGTLFLDEVGEMSPGMQGKLLRVLQEGEIRRVGSERTRKVDVRVLAATNRDLAQMVEEGRFRRDLFFRLNVAPIALPPLRDRRDDIPLMVESFLAKLAKAAGRPASKPFDPAVLARLLAYRWPGNVRELENEMIRADALSGARITLSDLSPRIAAGDDPSVHAAEDPDSLALKPRVERLERSLLREALGRSGNNQTKAADLLGLSRFGLQKKLKRYNFVI
jgi:transcriptional regulator with GAF, ATPase, and Fis domain/tetratricopeptide (TPR) repeat protein